MGRGIDAQNGAIVLGIIASYVVQTTARHGQQSGSLKIDLSETNGVDELVELHATTAQPRIRLTARSPPAHLVGVG